MKFIIVHDEYDQRWKIFEDDGAIYLEAERQFNELNQLVDNPKIVWPIRFLTENRGWGWWTVWAAVDEVEKSLETFMPNPAKTLLIEEREYTPTELQDLLQKLGSHLATLHSLLGKNYATAHALKEGFNGAVKVGIAQLEGSKTRTVKDKEGQLMAGNELLRQTKRMQIQSDSVAIMLKGWVDSYEIAWQTISRIITLKMGEASLQTGRHA